MVRNELSPFWGLQFMSPEHPKIDVVMPVRNGAKYIEQAITSILADQSLISKLIVIDDGSTDNTRDIISRLNTRTEIQLVSQAGLGLTPALNRGLEESQAEFIARMDADDVSIKGRLPAQLAFLMRHPSIVAVGAQAEYIDEEGRALGTRTHYPLDPPEVRRQLFDIGCVICHPTVLIRREALVKCGGYHNAFTHAEDYDLWLRLTDHFEIANLPEVFLRYRRHSNQVSNDRNIQQSFSRDFALWCARERQAHRPDPSIAMTSPPKIGQLGTLSDSRSQGLVDLVLAYDAIEKSFDGRSAAVSDRALRAIPTLARNKYLSQRRRARYKLITWAAKTAIGRLKFLDAATFIVILIACRISDSRLFRSIRRPAFFLSPTTSI